MAALDRSRVAGLVEIEIAKIDDGAVASALRSILVRPRACLLGWDYGRNAGDPESFPGFVIAEHGPSDTGIAYSEHGFGPRHPWGLVFLSAPRFGMDSGWFETLEDAFRDSMAFEEPAS